MIEDVIEANYVDVLQCEIYPARIIFDTHIRSIERLNNAPNIYILPGLVDAHVHIESSMLLPSEFARIAVSHGTLAAVTDPHEIANVAGITGIDFMWENSARFPFQFVFGAPSCVPATSLESTGITITANDIDKLFQDGKASFLSEMMNFPGIVYNDPNVMAKIAVAQKYGKPIDGHAPRLKGEALQKYVCAGTNGAAIVITTDHECTSLAEAEEKIRLGMKILIREGSAAKNFNVLSSLINLYPDMVMICTDDFHPNDLVNGYINHFLTKGVEAGLNFFSLLRAATLNPVKHYKIDLGLVQIGDSADFIVVDNLQNFKVKQSFLKGNCIYDRMTNKFCETVKTKHVLNSHFGAAKIKQSDIVVTATSNNLKVIQAIEGDLRTEEILFNIKKNSIINSNIEADVLKLVIVNRYQPEKPNVAFIRGFGLKKGALASSVSHDSHHIIAVGCNDYSLVKAINHIITIKGGLAIAYNKSIIDLALDIAGLMSSASVEEVSEKYTTLNQLSFDLGCVLSAPFMTLSFMALLVIPELKLGTKGLFNVNNFEWTEMFI